MKTGEARLGIPPGNSETALKVSARPFSVSGSKTANSTELTFRGQSQFRWKRPPKVPERTADLRLAGVV